MERGVRWMGALALCLTGLLSGGCLEVRELPVVTVSKEESFGVAAKGLKSLKIELLSGDIAIRESDQPTTITVRAVKTGVALNEPEAVLCMNEIKIVAKVDKGKIKSDKSAEKISWNGSPINRPGWRPRVALEIGSPRRLTLEAIAHKGNILLTDLASTCTLQCDVGSIEVRKHTGGLTAKSDDGDILVESVSPKIQLTAERGVIRADLSGSKAVTGQIASTSGDIFLTLGDPFSARVECSAPNGKIVLGRKLDDVERTEGGLTGRIGEGKGLLKIEAEDGCITLK